jgi:hypothetical protein
MLTVATPTAAGGPAVPLRDFILTVFCLVDDLLKQFAPRRPRARGFAPALADSEVIAVELVGEFLGLGHDKGLFAHFRRHYAAESPGLLRVHRTTFARRAANLSALKRQLHAHLAGRLAAGGAPWLVDSLPVEVCKFGRANFCRRLRGDARFGYDHTRRTTFYGFRLHARATPDGAALAFGLAPADVSDQAMVEDLDPPPGTTGVGDRNYWAPKVQADLAARGVRLLAPFRAKKYDPGPARSRQLSRARWIIETALGQLAERFRIKRTWARDLWHLSHRTIRKVLSHTVAVWVNLTHGRPALDFDGLAA